MKKILICFIGTGSYLKFLPQYYQKIMDNFCLSEQKDFLVLTDGELSEVPNNIILKNIEHKPWPFITLERFGIIEQALSDIEQTYDWLVFMDADTIVNSKIEYDDFFNETKDYFGVHHPCHFMNMNPHNQKYGSFDRTNSRARVNDDDDLSIYWQGCLWGGKFPEIMELISDLDNRIQLDLKDDIIAQWHDESHLNKFFIENKDKVNTLSPSYAYPEDFNIAAKNHFEPKIIHLSKNNSEYHS